MAGDEDKRPSIYLLSEEVLPDPYAFYAQLRKDLPVCWIKPDSLWAVSCFKDVRKVLKNWEIFESSTADKLYREVSPKPPSFGNESPRQKRSPPRLILSQDPPEHTKYRTLINGAFSKEKIESLAPLMRKTARSLLNNFGKDKAVDFVEHFAYPYLRAIINDIIGLDNKQSIEELREWLTREEQVSLQKSDKALRAALERQYAYFTGILKERREHPQDDLITELVGAEVDGEKLSDYELCGLLCLVVSAGFMTTLHMLSHAIILLSRKPGLYTELRDKPSAVPAFVKELLRYSPSVLATVRTASRDTRLGGVRIRKGDTVVPILASANRDPAAYKNPDSFDLDRWRPRQHVSFGHGEHICPGSVLAQRELQIAIETLLESNLRFVCPPDGQVDRIQTLFIRGVVKLPVRLC